MSEVEGRSAVEWDCPGCGCENFASMVAVELLPEDVDFQPELGQGEWVQAPETVKCKTCHERFRLLYGDEL